MVKAKECEYCKNDGYYTPNKCLIDKEYGRNSDNYHWISLMINCKDKTIVLGINEEERFDEILTKGINYCPMCGRKLVEKVGDEE